MTKLPQAAPDQPLAFGRARRALLAAELPEIAGVRRFLLKATLFTLGRLVAVEGAERLRRVREPAIYVLNHNNSVEAVLAPMVLIALREGRLLHFLVDWMFLHLPLIGWVIRLSGPVPVYSKPAKFRLFDRYRRERARQPVLAACLERLARGDSLGIFPEGTRNGDPRRLLRGRPGLGELVLRTAVPVVPVGLHYPAAARLGRTPFLGRVVVRIGEPLAFGAERRAQTAAAGERRALARGVVASVMTRLAELSGKEVPAPFGGTVPDPLAAGLGDIPARPAVPHGGQPAVPSVESEPLRTAS
jgi:1-acyl-sn-glycerol-3-phosphate acyltransferase